jgi:nucleoside-diphosphate-sugar epimerase
MNKSKETRRKFLVTGGTGFIGSAVTRRLVQDGHFVRVLDDNSRGANRRLADILGSFELQTGDVRDPAVVARAVEGMDAVHHLAFVNGTEHFYSMPETVLEVGVKGMMNVIDACRKYDVGTLILASSSEVYQTPSKIPTAEDAPLIVPDPMNARYSYGGGKIISELLAINFGRKHFERVLIYRPHNVYGPDMGWEHVIPQFAVRLGRLVQEHSQGIIPFPIQGTGKETRSFCYIDDLVDGVMLVQERGAHMGIYHIGAQEEVTVAELARRIAVCFGRDIQVQPGQLTEGSTQRRCPDISKLAALGYSPRFSLQDGLPVICEWYKKHDSMAVLS